MRKKEEVNFPLVAVLTGVAILLVITVGGARYTGAVSSGLGTPGELPANLYLPDLICQLSVGNKIFVEAGADVPVAVRITNRGGAPATAFNYVLYDGDNPLKTGKFKSLALKGYEKWIETLSFPSAGTYKLSMSLDTDKKVQEISESNNNCLLILSVQ